MPEKEVRASFRLAIRREGRWLNAYFAETETMEGALQLGSVLVSFVEGRDEFFDRWKDLMKDMFAVSIEHTTGIAPSRMDEERAPEHERAGRGGSKRRVGRCSI